ncbi:MAG TPA: hypothetical protein VF503_25990 [Sphingobium sp.]|uniref:hypothetical protein n=1 Tax=Sphingobium sp. TaxID=1912891 RepID=UPI002ED3E020
MRLKSALALGLMVPVAGAVLLAAPVSAAKKEAAPSGPSIKPSPEAIKIYQDADKALKAKDAAGAKAKIDELQGVAKTPDDQYLVGQLLIGYGQANNDQNALRDGVNKSLDSGKLAPADAAKFNFFKGQFATQAKDYDGAIQAFTNAVNGGYNPGDTEVMLAEAYFSKATSGSNVANNQLTPQGKQIANDGLIHLKKAIEAKQAAGQPVDGSWYSRGFRMAALSGSPDQAYWSTSALKGGGQAENWRIALRSFQDSHRTMTRDENLDVLRLMAASGSLKESYSYGEYADAALKAGLFGEVKAVIEQGRSAGNLQPTQLADIYKVANDGIGADRASLPSAEASATKAANGKMAASTASAYLGYGDYAKAATLYRLALQKGGVSADEVNTRLGIALAKSGDTAGARAAFGAVTTPGARKDIAGFWTTWLDSKGAA